MDVVVSSVWTLNGDDGVDVVPGQNPGRPSHPFHTTRTTVFTQ